MRAHTPAGTVTWATAAAVAAGGAVVVAAGLVTGAAVAAGPDGVDSKLAANSILAMPAGSAYNETVITCSMRAVTAALHLPWKPKGLFCQLASRLVPDQRS